MTWTVAKLVAGILIGVGLLNVGLRAVGSRSRFGWHREPEPTRYFNFSNPDFDSSDDAWQVAPFPIGPADWPDADAFWIWGEP